MISAGALVPIRPDERAGPRSTATQRPSATFLAHLIAVANQAPQTRERRRAEPHEAAAAYARTLLLDNPTS
jgi:hypothetical protein